ncbi:MAG: hypothetical protein OCD02_22740 [Spirochaetaceae bacterium]
MKKQSWGKLSFASIILIFLLSSCVTDNSIEELSSEYFNVGNAFLELGDLEQSKKYYFKSLSINPDFHKSRFNLVEVLIGLSEFASAKENIDYLISKDFSNNKLKQQLAFLYYSEGLLRESIEEYLELYSTGYTSGDVKKNIVKLYYQLEEFEFALQFIDLMLLDNEDSEIYFIGGLTAESLGDSLLAISFFERSYNKGFKDLILLEHLADLYYSVTDAENFKNTLELIILSGDDARKSEAYFELAKVSLLWDNNFSKGFGYLEKAVSYGYNNKDNVLELLEQPNLIEVDKIRLFFEQNEILN